MCLLVEHQCSTVLGFLAFHVADPKKWNRTPKCVRCLNSLPLRNASKLCLSLAFKHLDIWPLTNCSSDSHFSLTAGVKNVYNNYSYVKLNLCESVTWPCKQRFWKGLEMFVTLNYNILVVSWAVSLEVRGSNPARTYIPRFVFHLHSSELGYKTNTAENWPPTLVCEAKKMKLLMLPAHRCILELV